MRQLLSAPIRWCREAVPTRRRPGSVGIFPAGRRRDLAVQERCAEFVADGIEWSYHIAGETPGFLQHGVDGFLVEIAIQALSQRGFEAGSVFETESDIADGC